MTLDQPVRGFPGPHRPAATSLECRALSLGVLLAVRRSRGVLALGLAVQVLVLGLFVTVGVGVFDYDLLAALHMEIWAGVVTAGEVVLLGLLGYLRWGTRLSPVERSAR